MRIRNLALATTLIGSVVACSATGDRGAGASDALDEAMPGVDETALDRSVDPCTDFYAFACGGYIAHVPATQHDAARAFGLQDQDDAILDTIVTEAQTAPVSEAERKFGDLYASCMATSTPSAAASVVASLLPEIRAATTPEQIAGVVGRLQRLGANAFLAIQSFDRTRKGSIVALPGGFDEWTEYSDADAVGKRTQMVAGLFQELEPTLAQADADAKAKTSVAIEAKLAAAAQAVSFDAMHPLGRKGLELAAPAFAWSTFFAGIGAPAELGAFNIPGLDYFTAVNDLWTTLTPDAIRTYVEARWIIANDPAMGQQRRSSNTEVLCKENSVMLMNGAIESRFLELSGVNADGQGKARTLFASIAAAFGEQLDAESFLDTSTRIEAKVKLAKMVGAIGASTHTDDFADVSIDRNAPFAALVQRLTSRSTDHMFASLGKPVDLSTVEFPAPMVNAAYDPMHNKVDVPGGILGGYFFSPRAKNLANFAAIGSVLGHELTHGFDDEGRLFDGDGDLRNWWSPQVADDFTARAQCLVDEYSAFTVDNVIDRRTGQPAHVNGQQTLGENIADNGGLRIAYRAAKLDQRKPTTVAGFSPPQQFFVSFAQLYCEKMSTETATMLLKYDEHSPGKARVNLPVSNFDAFSQAFSCAPGKPMVPSNRCQVW